jgi:hypothetical protein
MLRALYGAVIRPFRRSTNGYGGSNALVLEGNIGFVLKEDGFLILLG